MFRELLTRKLAGVVELSELQLKLLEGHFNLLERWNRRLNLTSIVALEEIVERHYAESLFLGNRLPAGGLSIVDIGSGGGFPGIPIAIFRPEYSITLLEAHQRKAVFLREAGRVIKNLSVISSRLDRVTEQFCWAVCRGINFESIEDHTANISLNVALLGGEALPSGRCFTWNKPIKLPWGESRFLWIGVRST